MNFDEWVDTFKPEQNKLCGDAPFDGTMFETYGVEIAEVQKTDPRLVWTLLDCNGNLRLIPGYHYVNRMGYFICAVPYTDEQAKQVTIDAEAS